MRAFKKTAAQGEVNITLVDAIPEGLAPFKCDGEHYILGHSESGNHHVLDRESARVFVGGETPSGMKILYAIIDKPTKIQQLAAGNPHETIGLNAGDVIRITPAIDYNPYAKAIERARD